MTSPSRVARVRKVIASDLKRFGPAILDQGVWSLAGFIASAMVGRLLGPEGLGWFALAVAILFGIGGFVNTLVIEPAAVFGPRDYDDQLKEYGALLLKASGVAGTGFLVIGAAILVMLPGTGPGIAGAALVVTLPAFLAWTARRLPYLSGEPLRAVPGTIVYVLGVVLCLAVLSRLDLLTPVSAVLALGIASAAHAVVGSLLWRPRFASASRRSDRVPLLKKHWAFGRWLMAAEGASWMLNYGMAAVSAAVIGISAAGGFRASQVLLRPYGIVFIGLTLAYIPTLARLIGEGHEDNAHALVARMGWGLSILGTLVFLVLLFGGGPVMALVFGEEFRSYGWLAAALAGAMMLHGWVTAYSVGLQSRDRTRDVFLGQAASAVITLVGSVSLGLWLGLAGFAITFWAATVGRLVVMRRLYFRALAR